jgi:hypothetical protein
VGEDGEQDAVHGCLVLALVSRREYPFPSPDTGDRYVAKDRKMRGQKKPRNRLAPPRPMRIASTVGWEALDRLRSQQAAFRATGYLHVLRLLTPGAAEVLEQHTRRLAGHRVACGTPHVTWEEQGVPEDNDVHRLFSDGALVGGLADLLGARQEGHRLTCWISRYREGEYISRHTDRAGSVQIVLLLGILSGAPGGTLMLTLPQGEVRLDLSPGDAVIFRASCIPHSTTPLVATPDCADPIRTVAVARYFFGLDAMRQPIR